MDHCTSVSDVAYRQRLRDASSHEALFHGTGSVPMDVGHLPLLHDPTAWNSLPEDMRDPDVSGDSYRQSLKMFLFAQY